MPKLYIGRNEVTPAIVTNKGIIPPVINYINRYNVVGLPTMENTIISNFYSDRFLFLPEKFNPQDNTWEIVFKVQTASDVSSKGCIIGNYGAFWQNSPAIAVRDSHFQMEIPTNPISGNKICDETGTYTVLANTVYWVKLYFTGNAYKLDYSLDGINYINDISYSSSSTIGEPEMGFSIGINYYGRDSVEWWRGSIDLSGCYIKINNAIWWKPEVHDMTVYRVVRNDTGNDFAREQKVWLLQNSNTFYIKDALGNELTGFRNWDNLPIDCRIVSNFSDRKHMTIDYSFNYEYTWNFHFKIITGNDVTTRQKINGSANNSDHKIPTIEINAWSGAPRFCIHISSNGNEWDIANSVIGGPELQPNTTYWINYGWTGSEYYVDLSWDDISYFRIITIQNSTHAYYAGDYIAIGNDLWDQYGSAPFLGAIDLSETYIDAENHRDWPLAPYSMNSNITRNDFKKGKCLVRIRNNSTGVVQL